MLSNRDNIRTGDFEDFHALFGGSIEIDMVRSDTGCYAGFQVLSLNSNM